MILIYIVVIRNCEIPLWHLQKNPLFQFLPIFHLKILSIQSAILSWPNSELPEATTVKYGVNR